MAALSILDDRYDNYVPRRISLLYPSDTTAAAGTDEVQTVTISGSPTGGTFTLTFGGQTTTALAYNATAGDVRRALEALSTIGEGNVTVSGNAGGPYIVTFVYDLGSANQAIMTAAHTFTGGSSPNIAVAETTAGVAGTTIKRVIMDSRALTFDRQTSEVTTEGTTELHRRTYTDAVRFTADQQIFQAAFEAAILDDYSGVAGESIRTFYTGDFSTQYFGLEVLFDATDIDNGVEVDYRVIVDKVKTQDYNPFVNLQRRASTGQSIVLEALKTSTDLLNRAIAGVPSGGAYFRRIKLSS